MVNRVATELVANFYPLGGGRRDYKSHRPLSRAKNNLSRVMPHAEDTHLLATRSSMRRCRSLMPLVSLAMRTPPRANTSLHDGGQRLILNRHGQLGSFAR